MKSESLQNISSGFSSVYEEYEQLSREDRIDISRRKTIRDHVSSYLKSDHKILEINAGSGIDAVYFAEKGHCVLATDISDGSEEYIKHKINSYGLKNLRFNKCSFTALDGIDEKFDHIFSNFGGLNCTDNLAAVFSEFDRLLNPLGYATLVIMPRYYPWEMASFITGNKNAFRRFKKHGVSANVGIDFIHTHYYSPTKIKKAFPRNFTHIKTRNIGTFYPSAHFLTLQKYKAIISKLLLFDNWINSSFMMPKGIGDYYIITFQKTNRP